MFAYAIPGDLRAGCCAQGAAISRRKIESGKCQQRPKRGKEEKSRREGKTADDPVVCTFWTFWRGGGETARLGEGGGESFVRNAISIGTT